MQMDKADLCRDILVECFWRILPWNDPCVLKSVMSFDSQRLHAVNPNENGVEYRENECTLLEFKGTFLAWMATEDCTVEGVHAGMIIFKSCHKTLDILCEKLRYVGVSGDWTLSGWFTDLEAQYEHLRSETGLETSYNNPDKKYCALQDDIAVELMGRLLISLRFHPHSTKCLRLCACLLQQFTHIEDWIDSYDESNAMLVMLESEIKLAIKPKFKLMNPRLWDLNIAGVDIDKGRWRNTEWKQRADKKLEKYVRALCSTWNVLTVMQTEQIHRANINWLQGNHRQINWFSISDHVIRLLELRQKYIVLNWL